MALTIPALAALFAYVVWHVPTLVRTTLETQRAHVELVRAAYDQGEWSDALLAVVEMLLLLVPSIGVTFFLAVLVRRAARPAARIPAALRGRTAAEELRRAVQAAGGSMRISTPALGDAVGRRARTRIQRRLGRAGLQAVPAPAEKDDTGWVTLALAEPPARPEPRG